MESSVDEVRRSLDKCMDFACVFEVVKRIVKRDLGMSRGGLMLGLTDLPENVGAFHGVGGNFIVINRRLLDIVVRSATDRRQINSYVFYILLHEYLHALGFLSEGQVKKLSEQLCAKAFGEDHSTTKMARNGLGGVLRDIHVVDHLDVGEDIRVPGSLEIISDFDREITKWYV